VSLRVKKTHILVLGIIATNAQIVRALVGVVGITGSAIRAKILNHLMNLVILHTSESFSGGQKIRGMCVMFITQDGSSVRHPTRRGLIRGANHGRPPLFSEMW